MNVGVGSGNPVKEAATRQALTSDWDAFGDEMTVTREPVASGVSEQPRGHAETREGAITRARRAFEAGYDLGVGIEGGVTGEYRAIAGEYGGRSDGDEATTDGYEGDRDATTGDRDAPNGSAGGRLSLIMWAAVTDGNSVGVGGGPTIPLPDRIGSRVQAGEELGPVMDDVLNEEGVARNQGASGAVTSGRIDRTDALAAAVAAALAPFVSELYEHPP